MAKKRAKKAEADRHLSPKIGFHLEEELYEALHSYRKSLELRPSATEVVRAALREFLAARGYWPPQKDGKT